MKPIILFLAALIISRLGFAEGQRSFTSEFMYCDYEQEDCRPIESGKIEATRQANAGCAPQVAIQISDWIDFEKNISPSHPASWVKAKFVCAESQSDDVTCNKVGTSYTVKCCDSSGSCWFEY